MNEIIQRVLDLPGTVTSRVMGSRVDDALGGFNGRGGIRSYFKSIYAILALATTALMLVNLINGLGDHFSEASGLGMVGSVVTTVICLVAAFAIPNVIRQRGDSFDAEHKGMVHFIANDVVKTNLRLVGEIGALLAFTHALCMAVATLFGTDLYAPLGGTEMMTHLSSSVDWTMNMFADNTGIDLRSLIEMGTADTAAGSWSWDSVHDTFMALINAMLILAVYYVYLAIYSVGYNVVAWLVNWVQNPHLPIKTS